MLRRLDDPEVYRTVQQLADAASRVRKIMEISGHETAVPGLSVPADDPGRWLAIDGGSWVYPDRWRPETLARESAKDPEVFQLPSYAPDLNPVAGIWSVLKRGPLANVAFTGFAHLLHVIKHGLRIIQYQPGLIDGCLTGTGFSLEPHGPTS